MSDLIERIRLIIDHHRRDEDADSAGVTCRCGATALSDHARHVAEQIVDRLSLGPETVGGLTTRVRYVSAVLDDELTKLEGAE